MHKVGFTVGVPRAMRLQPRHERADDLQLRLCNSCYGIWHLKFTIGRASARGD